jgi:hypothetical protein
MEDALFLLHVRIINHEYVNYIEKKYNMIRNQLNV